MSLSDTAEIIKQTTDVARKLPGVLHYFALRRRILRNPAAIATDSDIKAENPVRFAMRPATVAGLVVVVINLIFTAIDSGLGIKSDLNVLDEISSYDYPAFVSLFNQLLSFFASFSTTFALATAGSFVARFANSDDIQQFGVRELRRRFLVSVGVLGVWPAIVMSVLVALLINIGIVWDHYDFTGLDWLQEWWATLPLAQSLQWEETQVFAIVLAAMLLALLIWAMFNWVVATPRLFTRSLVELRAGRSRIRLRLRAAATMLVAQPLLNAFYLGLSYAAAGIAALALYLGTHYALTLVGREDVTDFRNAFVDLTGYNPWAGGRHAVIIIEPPAPPPPPPPVQ